MLLFVKVQCAKATEALLALAEKELNVRLALNVRALFVLLDHCIKEVKVIHLLCCPHYRVFFGRFLLPLSFL
jgi:hypothetical protein